MAAWGPFLVVVLVTGFIGRLVTVWILTGYPLPPSTDGKKRRSLKTLIVLGSGGHTAEILNVVRALSFERYQPRCYIAAVTDNHSLSKAQRVEEVAASEKAGDKRYQQPTYHLIYRSREVGQSYLTSIGTTLMAMVHAFWLVVRIRPDVILCNGPGTCLPICIAGFFLKVNSKDRVTALRDPLIDYRMWHGHPHSPETAQAKIGNPDQFATRYRSVTGSS